MFRTQTHFSGPRFTFLQIQNVLLEANPLFFRASNVICGSRASFLCSKSQQFRFFTGAKPHYKARVFSNPKPHFYHPNPHFQSKPYSEGSKPDAEGPNAKIRVQNLLFQTKPPFWGPHFDQRSYRWGSRLYVGSTGVHWEHSWSIGCFKWLWTGSEGHWESFLWLWIALEGAGSLFNVYGKHHGGFGGLLTTSEQHWRVLRWLGSAGNHWQCFKWLGMIVWGLGNLLNYSAQQRGGGVLCFEVFWVALNYTGRHWPCFKWVRTALGVTEKKLRLSRENWGALWVFCKGLDSTGCHWEWFRRLWKAFGGTGGTSRLHGSFLLVSLRQCPKHPPSIV